ncbi:MAG: hypothetical protein WCZ65_11990, partial [Lysobacteraceae bacterium]
NGAMPGSPFFWSLFFGETKKSDSAAAEADETRRQPQVRRVKPNHKQPKPQTPSRFQPTLANP